MATASPLTAIAAGGGAEPDGDVGANACESAGGGEWCHGTGFDWGLERCYSNYKHNKNFHSSTAVKGPRTETSYAVAKEWSEASVTNGYIHTCYTYYNEDA